MNILTIQYKNFKSLFSKEICIYTLILIFHLMRKTVFNKARNMGDTSVDSSTFLLLICIGLNLYVVLKNNTILGISIKQTRLYLYYIIWCFFSFLWSIVPGFNTIIIKDAEVLSSYLFLSVVLYKIKSKYDAMVYLLYVTTFATSLGILRTILLGGGFHTNTYSLTGALGVILALGMYKIYRHEWIKLHLLINLICLIVGTSSASYISCLVALLVYISSSKRGVNPLKIIFVGTILYFGFSAIKDVLYEYIFYGHSKDSIEGGTGRYEIWEEFFEGWKLSPWLGHGFIIGERNLSAMGGRPFIFSCHNGYLSILVNTGIIGCLFMLPLFFKTIFRCIKDSYNTFCGPESTVLLSCLIVLLINNLSYPAFGSDWNYTFPPIMLLIILILTIRSKTCN